MIESEVLYDPESLPRLSKVIQYEKVVAIPMSRDISLADCCIPLQLLPNRIRVSNSMDMSSLFHTLAKPKSQSFATFEDSEENIRYLQCSFLSNNVYSDPSNKRHLNEPGDIAAETYSSTEAIEDNPTEPQKVENELSIEAVLPIVEIPIAYQKNLVQEDILKKQKQRGKKKNNTNKTMQLKDGDISAVTNSSSKAMEDDPTEPQEVENEPSVKAVLPIIELPIAYKKNPVQEDIPKKQKQRGKKKNNTNKTMQLKDYLETPNQNGGYEIPTRDLFYESIIRQRNRDPLNFFYESDPPEDDFDFPSVSEAPSVDDVSFQTWVSCDAGLNKADSVKDVQFSISEINDAKDDNAEITTLLLENVPCGTSKANVDSLMADYGEAVEISFEKDGQFLKVYVKLKLDPDSSVDWIAQCLDGSEAFGQSSGAIKCYRK